MSRRDNAPFHRRVDQPSRQMPHAVDFTVRQRNRSLKALPMIEESNKLIDTVAGWLAKLHRVGGLKLVFVFVGTIWMASGHFWGGIHSGIIVAVGAGVTVASLCLFALDQILVVKTGRHFGDFCDRVTGYWWERINQDDSSALSFITIETDSATGTIKMTGNAYDLQGMFIARWSSGACCINAAERKVYYNWIGSHPNTAEKYEGWGEITFHLSSDRIDRGDGHFSDANLSKPESTRTKCFNLRRSTEDKDRQVMEGTDADAISVLVREKLKQSI